MVSLARLTATQEAGAATEMPCATPPTRVYPAGTEPGELGAAGLAAGLPDTAAADADRVAETAGFTVPGALPHDVTATPIPITTGSAKPATLVCTFAAFPRNRGKRTGGSFEAGSDAPGRHSPSETSGCESSQSTHFYKSQHFSAYVHRGVRSCRSDIRMGATVCASMTRWEAIRTRHSCQTEEHLSWLTRPPRRIRCAFPGAGC
jgi:hypothetical protein